MPLPHRVPDFSGEEALFWREGRESESSTQSYVQPAARQEVESLREKVKRSFVEWYRATPRQPVDTRQLELMRSSWDEQEFVTVLDVIMDGRMTMGGKTTQFEEAWARFLASGGALMVGSGSSANLLAFAALSSPDLPNRLCLGDEVIVPAVTWSTSVFPIVQMGCVPVFVDINSDTLNLDPDQIEQAITQKTRAILAVHLLGNPCEMDRIMAIARKHSLWVIEDCCESHGAKVGECAVGTFGDLSTFSFFFSHHMTTIEGGAICFQDQVRWRDRLISLRAHGWVRGRSDHAQWKAQYPDIDDRWLFVSLGYNVRPTDINAAIGLVQLEKLPTFIKSRRVVRQQVLEQLNGWKKWLRFQVERPGHTHSAFGFSFIVDPKAPFTRDMFRDHLEACGIQTRPIVGSNFVRQPVMRHLPHRVHGSLTGADLVHYHGLMVGNHHDVTLSQTAYLVEVVSEYLQRYEP